LLLFLGEITWIEDIIKGMEIDVMNSPVEEPGSAIYCSAVRYPLRGTGDPYRLSTTFFRHVAPCLEEQLQKSG
jgi:hypothetical protein